MSQRSSSCLQHKRKAGIKRDIKAKGALTLSQHKVQCRTTSHWGDFGSSF